MQVVRALPRLPLIVHLLEDDQSSPQFSQHDSLPPIKPDACTNTVSGTPVTFASSSSRSPLHCSGSGLRLSKLSGEAGTACILHFPLSSGYNM